MFVNNGSIQQGKIVYYDCLLGAETDGAKIESTQMTHAKTANEQSSATKRHAVTMIVYFIQFVYIDVFDDAAEHSYSQNRICCILALKYASNRISFNDFLRIN